MLNVVRLNVVRLNVVILSVVPPVKGLLNLVALCLNDQLLDQLILKACHRKSTLLKLKN